MKLNGTSKQQQKIGLALGGGVVRGFVHIGALEVIDSLQIPISCVAGSSAGAIMGAFYCAGMDVEYAKQLANDISWTRMVKPVISRDAFLSLDRLADWLIDHLGDIHFEDLSIPLTIIATDMDTGYPVQLNSGPLAPAVCASCAVPGFFKLLNIDGYRLGDGGVSNNLPVDVVRQMGANYVIGVDPFHPTPRWHLGPLGRGITAIEILVENAGGGPKAADCLISPSLTNISYLNFGQRDAIIEQGRQSAAAALSTLTLTSLNTPQTNST